MKIFTIIIFFVVGLMVGKILVLNAKMKIIYGMSEVLQTTVNRHGQLIQELMK